MDDTTASLRSRLVALLEGGQAYDKLEDLLAEVPQAAGGQVPEHAERSAWQILEHMRRSLRDILDFYQNENGTYREMNWPEDYWPTDPKPPSESAWAVAAEEFRRDRRELEQLVNGRDLFEPFPWGDGQNLLREALLAADHQAYHLGELVLLTRLLSDR